MFLRDIQMSDLQRRLRKLKAVNVLQSLVELGSFASARFNDKLFVVRLVDHGGRVVRAYGESLSVCILNLAYGYFCREGLC